MSDTPSQNEFPRPEELLPHRAPFLLVDEIVELQPGERCIALWHLTGDEEFFAGHFPDRPTLPGVLMVEALAQTAGLAAASASPLEGKLALFGGIDKARFRRQVIPGDTLRLEATIDRLSARAGKASGTASVDGQAACEASMMFLIANTADWATAPVAANRSPGVARRPTAALMPSASVSSGELDIDRFRGWALGNLVDNRNRGLFAEWLVGEALGVIDEATPRREWDAYDLMYRNTKIEIKASGRSQSWSQDQPSTIRFGIEQRSSSWTAVSDEWIPHDQPTRFADVYVFCLHEPVPATNENVADPTHWTFWVVSTEVLDQELGSQKSVGMRTLNRLASPIAWSDIREEVDACVDSRQSI